MIKGIEFFKKIPNLKDWVFKDLAQKFQLEKLQVTENATNFGESGDKFYIVLLGVLEVEIPNPSIK